MKFRTEISILPSVHKVDHASRILTLGSCFADRVAGRLADGGFRVCANPLGELFNPASIALSLERFAARRHFVPSDLCCRDDVWFSYDAHGKFDDTDPERVLRRLNEAVDEGAEALERADWVVLTLGTAWVYNLAEGGDVVANCHRMPAALFERKRLSVSDVVGRLLSVIDGPLRGKRVVLTVSPVRHLADGLEGNALSKAVLRVAVDEVVSQRAEVSYFAAYEAVIDDLRDYRYSAADLTHPSDEAVEYVWELFCGAYFAPATVELAERVAELKRAASHRPLHPSSRQSELFRGAMLRKAEQLQAAHGELDLSAEIAFFGQKIGSEGCE